MTDIRTLVVAAPGWRVAVATAVHPDGAATVAVVPLVGWAQVSDLDAGDYWVPAWWDDLGLCTGFPQQVAWPLAPGEDLDGELAGHLCEEASGSYRALSARWAAKRAGAQS